MFAEFLVFFVADAQRASKQKSVLHVVALLIFFSLSCTSLAESL